MVDFNDLELGYHIAARPGMDAADIQTPCLIVDLDALDRNIATMQRSADTFGVKLRVHGKMHKSAEIAALQIAAGAIGICCQKVSEAEAFARAGITDILISNEIRDSVKIHRLAHLPKLGAKIAICVDDIDNVAQLSQAAQHCGTTLYVLVEIDCGAGRCGIAPGAAVVPLAKAILAAPGLHFSGLQAYQGSAQHLQTFDARKSKIDAAIAMVRQTVTALSTAGIRCPTVTGAGTGSYEFEGRSGVYTEIQCGSYAFMDADYQTILDPRGRPVETFENSLFVLTSVMSHVKADHAVVDAGLKVLTAESGLPTVFGRPELRFSSLSDEHGEIEDPQGALKIGDKLRLVPGHCDPTCNLHDWYVGVRGGKVERLIAVTARGKAF